MPLKFFRRPSQAGHLRTPRRRAAEEMGSPSHGRETRRTQGSQALRRLGGDQGEETNEMCSGAKPLKTAKRSVS